MSNDNERQAEALIAEIISGAELDAKNIEEESRRELENIEAISASEIAHINDDAKRKIERVRKDILDSSRTNAELEARKHSLSARRSILDKVFVQALEKMCALSGYERGDLLINTAKKNAEGGEVIRPAKADVDALTRVLPVINREFENPLTIGEVYPDIKGGFVLESELYDINCSFEEMLREVREEHEGNIAKLLFID